MFNENIPFIGRDGDDRNHIVPENDVTLSGRARICVIGVGGAGNNAVNRMIEAGIVSAEYIAVNTDAQILACNKAKTKIQIGGQRTKGLGAGAEPEIGREAAEESKEELSRAIEGVDLLFITAGMGGGTGTGAAPVIAKIAKDKKILTVAVVTKPFEFEGKRRMDNAVKGIENLRKYVDTIVIIPNEKIREVVPKNATMPDALRVADEVLKQGIRGIADLIVTPALINLDFADVRTVLKDRGDAHMGVGVAKGENRIIDAVRLAVNSPLLETTIEGATGVILNIVGGPDLTLDEVTKAAGLIHGVVDYTANIIFGACIDENVQDEVEVTVIATGFRAPDTADVVRAAFMGQKDVLQPQDGQPAQQADPYRQGQPYAGPAQQNAYGQPQAPQYGGQANGYARPQAPQAPNAYPQGAQYDRAAAQPNAYGQPQAPQYGGQANGYAQPQAPQQNAYGQPPQYGAPQGQYPPEAPAQPVAEEPAEDPREKRLPPFVRRMLGKK